MAEKLTLSSIGATLASIASGAGVAEEAIKKFFASAGTAGQLASSKIVRQVATRSDLNDLLNIESQIKSFVNSSAFKSASSKNPELKNAATDILTHFSSNVNQMMDMVEKSVGKVEASTGKLLKAGDYQKLKSSFSETAGGTELFDAYVKSAGGIDKINTQHIKSLTDILTDAKKFESKLDPIDSKVASLNKYRDALTQKIDEEARKDSIDKTRLSDLVAARDLVDSVIVKTTDAYAKIRTAGTIDTADKAEHAVSVGKDVVAETDSKNEAKAAASEAKAAAEAEEKRKNEEEGRLAVENAIAASQAEQKRLSELALNDVRQFRKELRAKLAEESAVRAEVARQQENFNKLANSVSQQKKALIDEYNSRVSENEQLKISVSLNETLYSKILSVNPALAQQVDSLRSENNELLRQDEKLKSVNTRYAEISNVVKNYRASASAAGVELDSAWSKVLNSARVGVGGIQGGISGLFSQMSFSLSSLLGNSKDKIADFLDKFLKPGVLAVAGVIVSLTKSVVVGLIDAFKPFEFKSAQLASILGTTRDKINDLDNSAKQLARDTMWTVGQIQELQISLAKLGFRADEIRDATKAIQQMATAMDSDLAAAANLAGTAIRAWNLDASEAGRVASTLAVATTKCALDFQKLDMSLPYVSNAAATLGWTVEETTALLGKLADQGMKTSTMGTSLRSIMLKLSDPMSKLSKQLGNPKTFQEFLKGLKECQDAGYDLGTMLELTDKRSVNAFAALTRNADAVRNLTASITDCEAEMAKMEETRLNTFEGKVKLLESAWDNFKVSLSETSVFLGIISILESCLTGLTNFMNGVWHSKDALERTEDNFNSAKSALDEATSSYERYMSIIKNSNEYTHSTVLKTIAELNSLIGETAVSYNEATKQIEFNTEALKNWSETFSKTLKQKAAWDSLDDIQKQIDEYNSKIDSIIADTGLTREQVFDISNGKNIRRVRTSGSTFYRYKERQNLYAYQVDKVLSNRELFSTLQDLESNYADIVKEYGTRPVQEEPGAPTHEDFVKQLNNFNRVDSDLKSSDLPDKEKADDAKAAKSAALSAMRANLNNRRQTEGDTAQFKQDWETYRKLQNQFDAESGRSGKGKSNPKDQYTKLDWKTAAYRLEENSHNLKLNNLNKQQVYGYITPTQYQQLVNDENIRYNNAQIEAIKAFQKAEGLDAGTFDINSTENRLDVIHNSLLNASTLDSKTVESLKLEKKMLEDKKKLWSESNAELNKYLKENLEIIKSYGTAYEMQQAEIALNLLESTNKYKNQMTAIEHEIQAKQGKSGIYSALGLFDNYASDIRDLKVQSATVERNSLDIQRKEIQRKITEKQNEISILEVSAPNSAILTKAKTELSELQQSLKEFEENYRSITDKIKQANLELVDSFNSTLDKFSSVLSKFDLSTQSFGSTFSNVQKQVAEAMKSYTESVTKSDAFQAMDADKQEAWLKGNADKQKNINALTWSFTQLANVTDTMMQLDKQKLDEDIKNGKISEKEAKKRLKSMAYTQAAVSLASYLASTGLQMYEIWRSPSLELWSKIAMTVATAASTIATGYATYESIRRIGDGGSASVSSNVATLSTQSEYGQQQTTYALVGESGNSSVADAVNSSSGGSTPVLVVETLHDVESNMNNVAIQSNY